MLPKDSLCFCRIPANYTYLQGHGYIFECGQFQTYDKSVVKTKYVCVFHIHVSSFHIAEERAGIQETAKLALQLERCALYNLTCCVMLEATNVFNKTPEKAAECFCRLPVKLEETVGDSVKFSFVCSKIKDGCSWRSRVQDTGFTRESLHPEMNETAQKKSFMQDVLREIHKKSLLNILSQPEKQQKNRQYYDL
ncbi:hypothetical protein BY458DRAFT_576918 [Sporodiniella umbellata]|nr:hypothetical protein BY458DRAFT_576918 [Sporodiniella umbellata]